MNLDRRIFFTEFAVAAVLGFLGFLSYYVNVVWLVQFDQTRISQLGVYYTAFWIGNFLLDPVLLAVLMFRIGRRFDLPNSYRKAIVSLVLGYVLGEIVGSGAGIPQILTVVLNSNPTTTYYPDKNSFLIGYVAITLLSHNGRILLSALTAFIFPFGGLAIGYFHQQHKSLSKSKVMSEGKVQGAPDSNVHPDSDGNFPQE